MDVAISIASAGSGARPERSVVTTARRSVSPSTSPLGNSFCSDSATWANCSSRPPRRWVSPSAAEAQDSFAAATRRLAAATQFGSMRPSVSSR